VKGRTRKYATNADRQRAYRDRRRPPADLRVPDHFDLPRETDGRQWTLRSFVWEMVVNDGLSVGFVAERLEVGRQVIRACLMLTPNSLPQAAPGTEKSVTKPAWLPRFYADSWCEWYIEVSRRGRPRQWYDDKSRKRAWWMRKVAVQYKFTGFWADQAAQVQAAKMRGKRPPQSVRELGRLRIGCKATKPSESKPAA